MLLSSVSFLVVAQSSSEVPEGLMNNPVYTTLAFLALLGAPYIYEISSLRVNIIKWQVKINPVA